MEEDPIYQKKLQQRKVQKVEDKPKSPPKQVEKSSS